MVVAANVSYPTDSGLLAKAVRRIAATGRRIQAAGGAVRTKIRDRGRSAGARAHAIAAKLRLRGVQARDEAQQTVQRVTGEIPPHSAPEDRPKPDRPTTETHPPPHRLFSAVLEAPPGTCFDARSRILLLGSCQVWRCVASGGHFSPHTRYTVARSRKRRQSGESVRCLRRASPSSGVPSGGSPNLALSSYLIMWATRWG
jgi:hypothetical protein